MKCMAFKLKFSGLFLSFFLKKYIFKYKKRGSDLSEPLVMNLIINYMPGLTSTRRFNTRPCSVELSATGLVSPLDTVLIRFASTPELTK